MKLLVYLSLILIFPTLGNAQDPRGLEAEVKFFQAIENDKAEILGRWEYPNSRDSSCDYIIKFREFSIPWICYAPPSHEFCEAIRESRRFNEFIQVSKTNFLADYQRGSGRDSAFCFSPGPIQYR